jgi:hypothetical protein
MTSLTTRILPLLLCVLAASVPTQTQAQTAAATPSATRDTGISIPNMDPSVHPGDNFYLYANGG